MVYLGDVRNGGGATRNRLAGVSLGARGSVTALALTGITATCQRSPSTGMAVSTSGALSKSPLRRTTRGVVARVAIATSAVTQVVPYYETPRSLARPAVGGTSGALTLVRTGSSLLVTGDFSDYGTAARSGLAAYDLVTGALSSDFNPSPDGPVNIVKASANAEAVFVGGYFDNIAGEPHGKMAKLDIDTGQNVTGFAATANAPT